MSRRSRAVPHAEPSRRALLALTLLAAACGGEPPGPGPWVDLDGARVRELHPQGDGPGFRAVPAEASGVVASNDLSPEAALENRTLADGSGVAIGDYDGDGLPDLYIARIAAPNALYRNVGGFRFEDVTAAAGVALEDRPSTGTAFADVDGDGDLDLLVTALGGPNTLFRNEGDGRFADVSASAGFTVARASRSLALADVDGDGDLDLYVTNNRSAVVRDLFAPDERSRDRIIVRDGGRCEVRPEMAEYFGVECFDAGTRMFELAEEDEFYLNDGNGRFELQSFTDGRFIDEDGEPLAAAPLDWGLSVRFHDLDGNDTQDLYVCNDFESPDHVWLNDGTGRFRAAGTERIRSTSLACMAIDVADVDRDGNQDLFTADMEPLGDARRKRSIAPMASDTTAPGALDTRAQRARNTLQVQRDDGTYADVALMAGVAGSEWTWGSLFLDVDLDGWEDLLVATGHVWDLLDADTQFRVGQARESIDWREEQRLYPAMPLRNLAFRNRGDGTFDERGETWGFGVGPDISHGLAAGDLDLDGDLDLVLTRLNETPLVLENRTAAPRVAVRLDGLPPNTRGIGATIRVLGGAVPVQAREIAGAAGYLSASEPMWAFAVGSASAVDIEVVWPSGAVSRVEGIPPNRLVEISESGAGPAPAPDPPPAPLFERTELDAHAEPFFDELIRQPLLPMRLAQLGPGVTWADLDGDDDPDLIVGSGRGGRPAVYRNEDGRLVRAALDVPATPLDQTTILPVPGASGTRLLVGRMSYEAGTPDVATSTPAVVEWRLPPGLAGRVVETPVVAGQLESIGPLAAADVDADGDLDLFVGGRVMPARYPLPVASRLYRNEGGEWRPDEAFDALAASLGLVSQALFSDLDGDADPDLVVALDWGPIRVFRNDGGRFRDATRQWGLDALPGRWNGLASGDLDADGRPDLIATSWGWNTGWGASPERPLFAYHGDFDGNGYWEVIRARADTSGVLMPLEDLRVLGPALPVLGRNVGSFADYSTATFEQLFASIPAAEPPVRAATLSHTLLLNRGDRFEPRPLPREAQVAPAFAAAVADVDGDGADDVFLTQNYFATVRGVPRYDAGRSLWLKGDGEGGLEAMPGSVTGIEVYGDPRGAAVADVDADGRIDVAVSQNGAETILFRNARATPGLRVVLAGPPGNPDAVGAALRVRYADGEGPLREIRSGSGYWSVDGPVQVFGLAAPPRAVWVRWPDGTEVEIEVPEGTGTLRISREGA